MRKDGCGCTQAFPISNFSMFCHGVVRLPMNHHGTYTVCLHPVGKLTNTSDIDDRSRERNIICVCSSLLTLAQLCLRYSLPDDAACVVHHGGRLKLHGLHHVPHADLQ